MLYIADVAQFYFNILRTTVPLRGSVALVLIGNVEFSLIQKRIQPSSKSCVIYALNLG